MQPTNSGQEVIQDSNLVTHLNDSQTGEMVIKSYRRKPLTLKMVKYKLIGALGREVPVEYRSPLQRRAFEIDCLALWHERGFDVPERREIPAQMQPEAPAIGLAAIRGQRLDRFLVDPAINEAAKLSAIAKIYREMHRRHCEAIFEQNHRLIHYDANLRNLILYQEKAVHIDFEMGHLTEDIDKSAAREVKKFTLQVLNLIDGNRVDQVLDLLLAHYQIRHIVLRLINEELQAPFMTLHMKRDLKRKQQQRGLITKLDIAFRLEQKLELAATPHTTNGKEKDLLKAIETSWDGKFYQSLDDSDPRGRDMNHRYAVLGVPDRFDDASVLDIGCNIGRICVDMKKRGALRAIGIDHRQDVVDAMNRHFNQNDIDVTLHAFDINEGVDALTSCIGPIPFDYVFVLSIWSHVNKQPLWDIINTYCAKTCFFEDNSPSRIRSLDKLKHILEDHLKFKTIEFMGFTTDRGVRAVYRLTK
ncbi:class I SAM-dependent methyltransferase [uncultured Desulfosarcina sp.]|uniref:class I SAM-dependent methyltransferase n=1 Tax=uncultured Desulfosarcina sp. TaxID=218289 RepID=UPI0029C717E7|nr:class I SAM-dependent methyltransferase [uncultured Desulfosarcina sp.]